MAARAGKTVGNVASGLDIPFLDLLGVRIEQDRGRHVARDARGPQGADQQLGVRALGGVVMTMLDVALATAAMSTEPDAPGLVTVSLSVSFVSAGSGSLVAEGRVIRGGRSLVFSEGEVRGADRTIVAKGVGTFKVRPRQGPVRRAR